MNVATAAPSGREKEAKNGMNAAGFGIPGIPRLTAPMNSRNSCCRQGRSSHCRKLMSECSQFADNCRQPLVSDLECRRLEPREVEPLCTPTTRMNVRHCGRVQTGLQARVVIRGL